MRKPLISGLIRAAHGTSAVEYALMLMIIVIVGTLGLNAFTLIVDGTFGSMASSLESGDGPRTVAIDDQQLTASANLQSPQEDAQTGQHFLILEIFTLTISLCAAAWAWHMLRRQRRRGQPLEEPSQADSPAPDTQLTKFLEKRQQILRMLTNDVSRIFESRIRVRHLMSTDIRSVKPSARQEQITEEMAQLHIRHLMVCDDGGRLLGVISNRDCRHQPGTRARELMTKQPATVSPETAITIAITMMMDRNISCLPVLEDGIVKGVLTTTDLLLSLQCSLQMLMKVANDEELLEKVLGALDVTPASTPAVDKPEEAADSDAANDPELIASG